MDGTRATKRRAACDECRHKKLKCTGEQPTCARCAREHISCMYSPQKQMGRPKKRQHTSEDQVAESSEVQVINGGSTGAASQAVPTYPTNAIGHNELSEQADQVVMSFPDISFPSTSQWFDVSTNDWGTGTANLPSAHSVPDLTPDSASCSPPMLNLPPELQTSHHSQHSNHGATLDFHLNSSLRELCPVPTTPNCACVSTMYLTLNTLSSMDTSFTFPYSLHPLRDALQATSDIMDCEDCPRRFITILQNTQLMGALFMSMADRFSKVLERITEEAQRAEASGESKKFRLADLNTAHSHLHAGGLGCAAAFSVNLSPAEWRSMCKKVVRAEVHGPSDGNDSSACLLGLIHRMEKRQQKWHAMKLPADTPKQNDVPFAHDRRPISDAQLANGSGDHLCLKSIGLSRQMIEGFDWT